MLISNEQNAEWGNAISLQLNHTHTLSHLIHSYAYLWIRDRSWMEQISCETSLAFKCHTINVHGPCCVCRPLVTSQMNFSVTFSQWNSNRILEHVRNFPCVRIAIKIFPFLFSFLSFECVCVRCVVCGNCGSGGGLNSMVRVEFTNSKFRYLSVCHRDLKNTCT